MLEIISPNFIIRLSQLSAKFSTKKRRKNPLCLSVCLTNHNLISYSIEKIERRSEINKIRFVLTIRRRIQLVLFSRRRGSRASQLANQI